MKFKIILALLAVSQSLGASPYIIGGQNIDKQPLVEQSTVSIVGRFNGELNSFCSGTFLGGSLVLTAAHCLADLNDSELYVAYGKDIRTSQLYKVKEFKYFYKNYFQKHDDNNLLEDQDIALVITESDIPLTPAEIGNPSSLRKRDFIVQAGYGNISPDEEDVNNPWSNFGHLFMLDLNEIFDLTSQTVVVKEFTHHRVSYGDSGGPLYKNSKNGFFLQGVLSQSGTYDYEKKEGVYAWYTHPYYFIEWMNCSLPEALSIHSETVLDLQVECDGQNFLSIKDIGKFNSHHCKIQRPGFDIVEGQGCWPITKDSCASYNEEVEDGVYWDTENNKCQSKGEISFLSWKLT